MRRLVMIALGCALLTGCASATAKPPYTGSTLAPDSALEECASPNAARPKPVTAPLAADFAGDRVTTAISLDNGKFQATPPPDSARPQITAALALCNELAAAEDNNVAMSEFARGTGFSFGLGVVTISSPVGGGFGYGGGANGQPDIPKPAGYTKRLAWIGVATPRVPAACPTMTTAPAPIPAAEQLPGYQIVVIDAQTGADGVLYIASANNLCGFAGDSAPGAQAATEFTSAPWSLVKRLPDGHFADITYRRRICDSKISGTVDGKPTVLSDRTHGGLVSVEIERAFARCGVPTSTALKLRGPLPSSPLPAKLIHAPTGAENVNP